MTTSEPNADRPTGDLRDEELRLVRAELDALRRSERSLRRIINDMPDAYVRTDPAGRIIMASPSAASLYGYASADDMIGVPAETLYADRTERQALIARMLDGGRVAEHVARGRRRDGRTFWVYGRRDCQPGGARGGGPVHPETVLQGRTRGQSP